MPISPALAKKIKKYGRMILSVIMVYMRLSDTVNIRVVLIARRLHIFGFFVDWEHTSKPLNRKDLGYWLKSTDATIVGNIFDNPGLLGIKRTGE